MNPFIRTRSSIVVAALAALTGVACGGGDPEQQEGATVTEPARELGSVQQDLPILHETECPGGGGGGQIPQCRSLLACGICFAANYALSPAGNGTLLCLSDSGVPERGRYGDVLDGNVCQMHTVAQETVSCTTSGVYCAASCD